MTAELSWSLASASWFSKLLVGIVLSTVVCFVKFYVEYKKNKDFLQSWKSQRTPRILHGNVGGFETILFLEMDFFCFFSAVPTSHSFIITGRQFVCYQAVNDKILYLCGYLSIESAF